MAAPLFPLGRVVATPGALNALVKAVQEPGALLQRVTRRATGATSCARMWRRTGVVSGTAGGS